MSSFKTITIQVLDNIGAFVCRLYGKHEATIQKTSVPTVVENTTEEARVEDQTNKILKDRITRETCSGNTELLEKYCRSYRSTKSPETLRLMEHFFEDNAQLTSWLANDASPEMLFLLPHSVLLVADGVKKEGG